MNSPATAVDGDASLSSSVILRLENVSKTFPDGQVRALVDVSLSVPAGEYLAIMGPSGSGKSTLLSVLGGLDRPDAGEVYFRGRAISGWHPLDEYRARHIGFVFQSFFLLPTLTALENVQVPMFETDRPVSARQPRAAELLDIVGLSHRARHRPTRLSVGERQRVAIARALANDPDILLADEPTGNLDSRTADDILALFSRLHCERQMTLVLVTHSQEVGRQAQRLIRFRDGRIESDTACGG